MFWATVMSLVCWISVVTLIVSVVTYLLEDATSRLSQLRSCAAHSGSYFGKYRAN
jgi:hypothetical protein